MTPARQQIHPAFARAAALDARQPAPAFLVVPPSGFSASYRKKPIAPIKVGLRLLSEERRSRRRWPVLLPRGPEPRDPRSVHARNDPRAVAEVRGALAELLAAHARDR